MSFKTVKGYQRKERGNSTMKMHKWYQRCLEKARFSSVSKEIMPTVPSNLFKFQ